MIKTTHLFGWNSMSHIFSQWNNLSRSFWRTEQSCKLLIAKYTAVSSATRRTWDVIELGRSFIYMRKSKGPSTEPWGTPDVTGTSVEHSPSSKTFCDLPRTKDLIHVTACLFTPYSCNLKSNFRWLTLSNTLLKSKRIRSVCWPFARLHARSSTSCTSCVSQERRSLVFPVILIS